MITPIKNTVFSGIQPSGTLHIGNYLGAIKQWVELQRDNQAYFCIVDLHAITVPYDNEHLPDHVLNAAAMYLACGIDPTKSTVFVQSHVPAHAELAWLLGTITRKSELERMRQFWEKGSKHDQDPEALSNLITGSQSAGEAAKEQFSNFLEKNKTGSPREFAQFFLKDIRDSGSAFSAIIEEMEDEELELFRNMVGQSIISEQKKSSLGLFAYPVLQAADILLYQTDVVPVGEDQVQHIELTRDIARRFNHRFGEVFTTPKPQVNKETMRVMSLTIPTRKMSKSDEPKSYIALIDAPDIIKKKIMSAVTETEFDIRMDTPSISNLRTIYQAFSDESLDIIDNRFSGQGYKEFKEELAELIVQTLNPIRERYEQLRQDQTTLKETLAAGQAKAEQVANKTLDQVKKKMGLL